LAGVAMNYIKRYVS